MSKEYRFEKQADLFRLIDDGEILFETGELAFCFDGEHGTLHRFGPRDGVEDWHRATDASYRASGLGDIADQLVLVSRSDWEIETIDRFVSITGNIGVWWRRNKDALAAEDQRNRLTAIQVAPEPGDEEGAGMFL